MNHLSTTRFQTCLYLSLLAGTLLGAPATFAQDAVPGFRFGVAETDASSKTPEPRPVAAIEENGVFALEVEVDAAYLPDSGADSDITTHQRLRPSVEYQFNDRWSAKASVDVDSYTEHGADDFNEIDLNYHENFIRYMLENGRITLGTQKVIWGSVDGAKPTDQLGSQDLRTFVTDDYEDRRQAVPALRAEYYRGDIKVDTMAVLSLRETETADDNGLWRILDRQGGRVIGVERNPLFAPVLTNASVDNDDDGFAGGGIRITKTSSVADISLSAQRVRNSTPYYQFNPNITDAIQRGVAPAVAAAAAEGATFTTRHPWTWVAGGDIAVPVGKAIIRAEGAWMSDVPVHNLAGEMEQHDHYAAVAGVEFYPGDGDLRIIVQGEAQGFIGTDAILEQEKTYSLNGSVEKEFGYGQWVAEVDYAVGLRNHGHYLNPKVEYTGIDDHELYIEGHYFDGNDDTALGFFRDNSQIMMGWNYEFSTAR